MMLTTHLACNHFLYIGGSLLFDHQVSMAEVIALTVTTPLPDIDTPQSTIGKTFPNVSRYLDTHHGHRTITHSIWAIILMLFFLTPLIIIHSPATYIAGFLGYFLHLVGDTFTKQGPMFLYPQVQRRFVSVIPDYRFVTGSSTEKVIFGILICLVLAMYPLQSSGLVPALESLFGNTKEENKAMLALAKSRTQYSLEELSAMLDDGIIDQSEYKNLMAQRQTTLAEMGVTESMLEGSSTEKQMCLAFVEQVDEYYIYLSTSPYCVYSERNNEGLFPVSVQDYERPTKEMKNIIGTDIRVFCFPENGNTIFQFFNLELVRLYVRISKTNAEHY